MSLARSLWRQVAELRAAQAGAAVREVRVEVGPLAGVEPLLLAAAFERLAGEWGLEQAVLRVDEVPLEAQCSRCQTICAVEGFRFMCPHCGAARLRVVRGDALVLESIVFAAPAEARSSIQEGAANDSRSPCPTP
jgi:hydrogenase nickel incorporation protein HypA/HybF